MRESKLSGSSRPLPAPAGMRSWPRDQLDPPHRRDGVIGAVVGLVRLRFKRMLKRMVKTFAHGPASGHSQSTAKMWGTNTAYIQAAHLEPDQWSTDQG